MERSDRTRILSLVFAASLGILFGEMLIASPVTAEVYLDMRTSVDKLLARTVGGPERRPRDLTINGQPLKFTPYSSSRGVDDISAEWLNTLRTDIRPATFYPGDLAQNLVADAANRFVRPKISRLGDDFATIVQFFDGDGAGAYAFFDRKIQAPNTHSPVPGVTVTIRRPPGSQKTEVVMSRFEDVPALLEAFQAPALEAALPVSLKPPPGTEVLTDLGDMGTAHVSRTLVSRGSISAENWAETRAQSLRREGFSVDGGRVRQSGLIAIHGRRGSVEADILYTSGQNPAEIIEVIEIRQARS